jgi:GNAT-family acetyltransferase (TIGR03103 family)
VPPPGRVVGPGDAGTDERHAEVGPTDPGILTGTPPGYHELNRYTRIIVDEACRRGVRVEVHDAGLGELTLTRGDRVRHTFESLSDLTSAVAFRRCDHKGITRSVLERAGLAVPPGRLATFDVHDHRFLERCGEIVVKPARGEQGWGITVGVTDVEDLEVALAEARAVCPEVLLEQRVHGEDLRVVVIADEVVAASVRRPPAVVGDGARTIAQLVAELSDERAAATDGAATIPLDDTTLAVIDAAGHAPDDVLAEGTRLAVRLTANVHTGGTIVDVTDDLHPELARAAVAAAQALAIPVVGMDLIVQAVDGPEHVFIEANEQPGLANHEPRPTVERFIDLLFPDTRR